MTPNKKTIKATHDSIEKWFSVRDDGKEERGRRDCALCTLFYRNGCYGCPVRDKTDLPYCKGSPYQKWSGGTETKAIATKEINFLISLLPTKEQRIYWYDD